jgi:hypothetical protein
LASYAQLVVIEQFESVLDSGRVAQHKKMSA